jgi:hypothetical protein
LTTLATDSDCNSNRSHPPIGNDIDEHDGNVASDDDGQDQEASDNSQNAISYVPMGAQIFHLNGGFQAAVSGILSVKENHYFNDERRKQSSTEKLESARLGHV